MEKSCRKYVPNASGQNGQNYQKQKGLGTSDQLLQVKKQVQKNFFISYILSDQV